MYLFTFTNKFTNETTTYQPSFKRAICKVKLLFSGDLASGTVIVLNSSVKKKKKRLTTTSVNTSKAASASDLFDRGEFGGYCWHKRGRYRQLFHFQEPFGGGGPDVGGVWTCICWWRQSERSGRRWRRLLLSAPEIFSPSDGLWPLSFDEYWSGAVLAFYQLSEFATS